MKKMAIPPTFLVTFVVGIVFLVVSCQTVQPVETGGEDTQETFGIELIPGDLPSEPQASEIPPVTQVSVIEVQPSIEQVQILYTEPIIQLQSDGFSPNNDGYRDTLEFFASIPVTQGLQRWELGLYDQSRQLVFLVRGTTGSPGQFSWNGLDPRGNPVPDGIYRARLTAQYRDGTTTTGESAVFRLNRKGPSGRIVVPNVYFSPDDDGINDTIPIRLELDDPDTIISYKITIYDSKSSVFETYTSAEAPPEVFVWDGKNRHGQVVEGADVYRLVLELTNDFGNVGILEGSIPTDVLVYREGDQFKIRVSSITFLPFSANFTDVAPSERVQNLRTLDRIVEILGRFPGYRIGVEGHAVQVYWNDPVRGPLEQRDALIPLSLARAQAIRQALINRGIDVNRLTATGAGGSKPVVSHGDLQDRWKNRRVEFTLFR